MKSKLIIEIIAILLVFLMDSALAQTKKSTGVSQLTTSKKHSLILTPDKPLIWQPPKGSLPVPTNIELKLKKSRVFQIETKTDGGVDLGGGVTINVNNRPALRDLVDQTTCQWISAREFQETYVPGTGRIIESIKNVHWYLGDAYEREIQDMLICLTSGPLKKIPDQDLDAVTVYPHETRQAAIRAGRLVFLDMSIFANMMNQMHREFLFVHEVTHSFIPFDRYSVEKRNESLRSFVKMLSEGFNADRLSVNIMANQLSVPATTAALDSYKQEILEVFNTSTPLSRRAHLAADLGKFIEPNLWITDRRRLKQIEQAYVELSDQIWGAISREDFRLIEYLYKQNNIEPSAQLYVAFRDQCYYHPTGLQIALFKCGSQPPDLRFQPKVIEFFIKKLNHRVSLDEIRFFIARTLRVTPESYAWIYFWQKNPQYTEVENAARLMVSTIPEAELREFLKDSNVQSSNLFTNLILERLKGK